MSDYCHRKAVRLRIDKKTAFRIFNVSDEWDLRETLEKTPFEIAPTYELFIDYNLPVNPYGEGTWGKTRELYPAELRKYSLIFAEKFPHELLDRNSLRLVEYCWYDGSEAPDYFDETTVHDNFYDEV